jgi:PIN domain nuclease of toxin-antitoxin system
MAILKQLRQRKLLLDTHIWIWLMLGDEKLSPSFKRTIQQIQMDEDRLLISAISIWELGMLVQKKRIELEIDCMDLVDQFLNGQGINLAALSPTIAILSTRLPNDPHGDPADRFLIATAYEHHAVLVTHDQQLLNYGKNQYIDVFDPCTI